MVHCGPQPIHVRSRVGVPHLNLVLLRRRIFRRAYATHGRLCARVVGIPQLDQAKVHQNHPPVGADDHVLRLDIAVDDALRVTVGQSIQNLTCPSQYLLLLHGTVSLDKSSQFLALDKIHDQVGVPPILKEIANPHEVRMAQASQDLRLLLELISQLGQSIRVYPRLSGHLFESHRDVESAVPRLVYGPHPALSKKGINAVTALQYFSGLEHSSSTGKSRHPCCGIQRRLAPHILYLSSAMPSRDHHAHFYATPSDSWFSPVQNATRPHRSRDMVAPVLPSAG